MPTFVLSSATPFMLLKQQILALDPAATAEISGFSQGPSVGAPVQNFFDSKTVVTIVSDILTQVQIDALQGDNPVQWTPAAQDRYVRARGTAKAIPNWATWSQQDLITWYSANISETQINAASTLAAMKVISTKQSQAILAVAQLLIAMRDMLWPDLGDR